MTNINILGSGLSGLSAAITLARKNIPVNLISRHVSERAQSVLAEGGINGALNTMGEDDCVENHFADTYRAGVYLADPNAVDGLTRRAPLIIRELEGLGVAFNTREGEIIQRNFGGQKKKRTAYARSSTGKILMTAMIDEARKYEAAGLITRFSHHEFLELILDKEGKICRGILVGDTYTGEKIAFYGRVIICCGGMNGIFPEMTTGTTANRGDVVTRLFAQGVVLGNLEMIQYHPTTYAICGKRCLITEAARGEGGRLYIERNGEKWYFMEEKYPELKNLMPRDVVSREIYFAVHDPANGNQVYLDMTGMPKETWLKKLPDLREEIIHYMNIDPAKEPIPVEPGIHYFMGGIDVDEKHHTNISNLYAAGECCNQYHGANRLGGNSLLGAIYGGKVAAETVENEDEIQGKITEPLKGEDAKKIDLFLHEEDYYAPAKDAFIRKVKDTLYDALGIVRNEKQMEEALQRVQSYQKEATNARERELVFLAEAMLLSGLARKESRGAHYRSDFPETNDDYRYVQQVVFTEQGIKLRKRRLPERRTS